MQRSTERINFGKVKEVIEPPNLIETQNRSYLEFLQADVPVEKRRNVGLQAVFNEVFPIESYDGKATLSFVRYEIGESKQSWLEALQEGVTYAAPLHVVFRLTEDQEGHKQSKEEKVYMGEVPLM